MTTDPIDEPTAANEIPGVERRGSSWRITHGSGRTRIRETWHDVATANARKQHFEECDRNGVPPIPKKEWVRGLDPQRALIESLRTRLDREAAEHAEKVRKSATLLAPFLLVFAEKSTGIRRPGTTRVRAVQLRLAAKYFAGEFTKGGKVGRSAVPAGGGVETLASVVSDPSRVDAFRDWLHAANYSATYAAQVLRASEAAFNAAIRLGLVATNPFIDVEARQQDADERPLTRNGVPRRQSGRRPWIWAEIVAIARMLRAAYLLPFWIQVLTGCRLGEVAGLVVGDWSSIKRCLAFDLQRQGSGRKRRVALKTAVSKRTIELASILCDAMDRYVLQRHGPPPSDPRELAAWKQRPLIGGIEAFALNSGTFCTAVAKALVRLGLVFETLGFKPQPTHHLRKGLNTHLRRLVERGELSGAAVAHYLGWKNSTFKPDPSVSEVGLDCYDLHHRVEIQQVAAAIDTWARDALVELGVTDLLDLGGISEDAITLDEATAILARPQHEVLELIRSGELEAQRCDSSDTTRSHFKAIVLNRADVLRVARALDSLERDTYPATHAARLLRISVERLPELTVAGALDAPDGDPRRRMNVGGDPLPGGGARYRRDQVDEIVNHNAERFLITETWLSVDQAAAATLLSTNTIREMSDLGDLESWIDDGLLHLPNVGSSIVVGPAGKRFISPAAVESLVQRQAVVTLYGAADRLGTEHAHVTALAKLGRLPKFSLSTNGGHLAAHIPAQAIEIEAARRNTLIAMQEATCIVMQLIVNGELTVDVVDGEFRIDPSELRAAVGERDEIWTAHEVAERLGMTTTRVAQLCKSGRLVAWRIEGKGRPWRIARRSVEAFERMRALPGIAAPTIQRRRSRWDNGKSSRSPHVEDAD